MTAFAEKDWVKMMGVVLTIITPIMVVGLGIFGNLRIQTVKTETEELRIAVDERLGQQNLDIRRQALENDQQIREWAVLTEWIPKLIDTAGGKAEEARAIIFVLFPEDAELILDNAFSSLTNKEREPLQDTINEVIRQAEQLAEETGPWTVVVSSVVDLEAASEEVEAAVKLGFTLVRVYIKDDLYVTTVGDFPTETDAESTSLVLREQISEIAFVVDLSQWCPNATEESAEGEEINLLSCPAPNVR